MVNDEGGCRIRCSIKVIEESAVSWLAGSGLVTDISSGREMSMEEFDRALGLHTALEVRDELLLSFNEKDRIADPVLMPSSYASFKAY